MTALIVIGLIGLYFLPAIVAETRGHRDHNAITFVTVFLGWLGFPWLIAMMWALTGNVKQAV